MADFLSNLWEAIFTAGPTPTLMVATNVTFGTLQVLLFGLLIATYSVHFAILSVLCGGLWYSINWFANEIRQAQAKEAEAERLRKKKRADARIVVEDADDEGEETEVEGGMKESTTSLSYQATGREDTGVKEKIIEAMTAPLQGTPPGTSSGMQPRHAAGDARNRRADESTSSASEISTDSEWEKVDQLVNE